MFIYCSEGQDAFEVASAVTRGPDTEGTPAGAKIRNLNFVWYKLKAKNRRKEFGNKDNEL